MPSHILFATPDSTHNACVSPASNPTQARLQPKEPCRRPPPRQKPLPSKGKPSFLFISALGTTNPTEASHLLLRCPVCSRTAFSSLQGLLNHARISHSIEWGSHDACIKACAVAEPNIDIESGIEVGIGPLGIRPGLQTIFERAVGIQSPAAVTIGPSKSGKFLHDDASQDAPLTQTLGIHEETPDLAPFLGKEAHRREIKVYQEDVDILESESADSLSIRPAWKMSFAPRHHPKTFSQINMNGSSPPELPVFEGESPALEGVDMAIMSMLSSRSRFHFSARIAISDRSLFVGSGELLIPSR